MSEFIKGLVDEAHAGYINGMFEECIRILKAVKFRVGTKEMFDEMNTKEQEFDTQYNVKLNEVIKKGIDDLTYTNMKNELKRTQCQRYLTFYSRIAERIP